MGLQMRVASEKDAKEWDSAVDASSHGTLFHKWDWLGIAGKHSKKKVLGKNVGCELYPLMAYNSDELVAIFPLYRYKYSSYEVVFSPPLKVDVHYLGPVIIGYDSLRQSRRESVFSDLIKGVDDFILSNFRPLYTVITSSPGLSDSRPLSWQGYDVTQRYTYELSLAPELKTIDDNFSKDVRRQMNLAKSAKVEITVGDEGVEPVYDLLFARHDERGFNQMGPKEYYREVWDRFSATNLKTFLAYDKGEIISGLIAIRYKDVVQLWFGTPRPQIEGVNELLVWESIKWSKENGFQRFENMGANFRHLCRFKSKFNPQLVPHFMAKKNNSRLFDKLTILKRLFS